MNTGCPVTVWQTLDEPIQQGRGRGERTVRTRACGEPVDRNGFCAKHADDRDRLMEGR